MPSRVIGKGRKGYYKRRGGAWIKRSGRLVHVGTGRGSYSKVNKAQDYQRRARRSPKMRRRYSQHYD